MVNPDVVTTDAVSTDVGSTLWPPVVWSPTPHAWSWPDRESPPALEVLGAPMRATSLELVAT
jgi:hypothetical protein